MILLYIFIIGNIMGVRIAKKEEKRDIYTIMSYCFNYGNDFINNCCKDTNFANDQHLVFEKNGKINSCISVIPFKMKFNGN